MEAQQVIPLEASTADGRRQTEASMRPVPVVLVDPWSEVLSAFGQVLISAGVGPFAQGGLDEALGLAVGAWRVRPCAAVLQAKRAATAGEGVRPVARAVVGQHGAEVDAEPRIVGECGIEEVQHRSPGFIRVHGREGDPRVVVDGDMDIPPARSVDGVAAVAGDPVRRPGDAAQLLDIQVQQVARGLVLVAPHHRGRLQAAHPVELEPAQDAAHRGLAQACLPRDPMPGPALPPQRLDPRHNLRRGRLAKPPRPRTAVRKPRCTLFTEPPHPLARRLRAHVEAGRGKNGRTIQPECQEVGQKRESCCPEGSMRVSILTQLRTIRLQIGRFLGTVSGTICLLDGLQKLRTISASAFSSVGRSWLRGLDLNQRPLGYERK